MSAPSPSPASSQWSAFRVRIIDDTVKSSARRLAWGALSLFLFMLLILGAGVAVTWFLTRTASEALPELPLNQNTITGLFDGEYALKVQGMTISEQGCLFEGFLDPPPVSNTPSDKPLLIAGGSLAECGTVLEGMRREVPPTASRVIFVVTDGVVQIARLEPVTDGVSIGGIGGA
jgi:hypothetical protein